MRSFGRWLLWMVLAGVALQVFFALRIAAMVVIDPTSTAFMRSEAWRVGVESLSTDKSWRWSHQWVAGDQISSNLKRAVIASEDAGFLEHGGVDWEAIETAWQKNEKRQQQAEKRAAAQPNKPVREPKVVGGSTITQQLAKNLMLSGERQFLRKGQELVLAVALEALLSKHLADRLFIFHYQNSSLHQSVPLQVRATQSSVRAIINRRDDDFMTTAAIQLHTQTTHKKRGATAPRHQPAAFSGGLELMVDADADVIFLVIDSGFVSRFLFFFVATHGVEGIQFGRFTQLILSAYRG